MQPSRLEKLLEFIKNEPNDEFLQYALATEYLRLDDKETALSYYKGLVTNHPGYVGTYYHLGKLYELLERKEDAIATYQSGMNAARAAKNNHALSELQSAYMQASGLYGDEDDDDF